MRKEISEVYALPFNDLQQSFTFLLSARENSPLLYIFGEGNGTPLRYSCLENPMDGGAWKAAVHGVAAVHGDMTERLHFHFSLSCIGEGNGNPL